MKTDCSSDPVIAVAGLTRKFGRKLALLTSRSVCRLFAAWLGVAICLLAGAGALWRSTPIAPALLLFALAWVWPAGELPQCTLHLAANRHR